MAHTLPNLGYEYNALEPHIDALTMEIHHSKHHQGYVNNLNKALEGTGKEDTPVEELLKDLSSLPHDKQQAVQNNGGGHANHSMFWKLLKPDVTAEGPAVDAITKKWGSLDAFKEDMNKAGMSRFGSGWVWLVLDHGELEIISTANQDSPVLEGKTPLIGIDCWEHGYYLKWKSDRKSYLDNIWNVMNWEQVNKNYQDAQGDNS